MKAGYVVIGTSPFVDTSIVVGSAGGWPVTARRADEIADELQHRGYVTEVCLIRPLAEVDLVRNDEGGT